MVSVSEAYQRNYKKVAKGQNPRTEKCMNYVTSNATEKIVKVKGLDIYIPPLTGKP